MEIVEIFTVLFFEAPNFPSIFLRYHSKPPDFHTLWLFNSLPQSVQLVVATPPSRLPWKITKLLMGKSTFLMGHLYHGYVK